MNVLLLTVHKLLFNFTLCLRIWRRNDQIIKFDLKPIKTSFNEERSLCSSKHYQRIKRAFKLGVYVNSTFLRRRNDTKDVLCPNKACVCAIVVLPFKIVCSRITLSHFSRKFLILSCDLGLNYSSQLTCQVASLIESLIMQHSAMDSAD